jgi:predicted metal-dependent peptidase
METALLKKADFELAKSVVKLLRAEPFYAHILSNLTRKMGLDIPTMAVSFKEDQLFLHINPVFLIEQLNENQRIGVLKHEVLHIVFKHLFRGNRKNPFVENLAADIVVNQFVAPWPLPEGAVYLTSFPELNLIKNQTLEYYYNELIKLQDKNAKSDSPISHAQFEKLKEDFEKTNGSHQLWSEEAQTNLDRIVNKVCKSSKEKLDNTSWGNVPNEIKRIIDLLSAPPVINWKNVLRIFSISCGRTTLRATHRKESKRFEGSEGTKIKRLRRLVVAIDTSGSINVDLFTKFWNEIVALNKTGTELMILQCDADIHSANIYKKSNTLPEIIGGGGTSFDPVFNWMKKNRQYNGLIYFTDGYAMKPTIKINLPTLWCVYGSNQDISDLPGKVIKVQ